MWHEVYNNSIAIPANGDTIIERYIAMVSRSIRREYRAKRSARRAGLL